MNRIIIFLVLGLTFFCQNLTAQSVPVEGTVKDSLQKPMELANVIAISKNSKAMVSFGVTDHLGRYKLKLEKDSTYIVRCSYIGFETWEEEITPKTSEKIIKNIVLKEAANQLDGVELVQELPISMDGDTITYKTDHFVNGKERKLADVIEKLPGFEIDENGDVKVQGKKVKEVLVEGEKFFDGDSKLATKNIPADAVDKIQLLRNYNEVDPMKGLDDNEDIALNIKLKDGKKNILFGDVRVGGGPEDRYVAHPNLFYYSKKASVNFIGDANNMGEQGFTMSDYFRFSGGLMSLARKSGSSLRLSSDDIGLSLMQNNRAEQIVSKMGALNFNLKPNKKWRFSGFGILNGLDTDMRSNSFRTYIRETGNLEENLTSNNNQKNTSGLFKASITHKPNSKLHMSYNGFVKTAKIEDMAHSLSDFNNTIDDITSINKRKPFAIEQTLDAYYSMNDRNVFSFEANQMYKKQDPLYELSKTLIPFNGDLAVDGTSPFEFLQNKEITSNKFDAALNYYFVMNKTNHVNFTLGGSFIHQDLSSFIDQKLDNGSTQTYTETSLNNDVGYDFSDVYFGLQYITKLGDLTLSPGANLHFYNTKDTQLGTTNNLEKTLLLPKMGARYKLPGSARLSANYNMQAEFTDIQNLALGTVIRGYNSLFSGNRNLENAWYHTISANFYDFNMFNFTNISAGLNYQKKYDGIQTNLTENINTLSRTLTPFNIDAANETLSGNGSYEKRLGKIKLKGSVALSSSKYTNQLNGMDNENKSFNQNYKASVDTNFKDLPNFEIGYEKNISNYNSATSESTFLTDAPFANMEAYFLKNFTLTADYKYNNYRNKNGGNSTIYDFLDMTLYYRKDGSPLEFSLTGKNLMNTTTIRQDGFSNNLISTFSYYVQPRYFLFSIKYDL